ncbi:MAG TPA: DUF4865 family protein, partial [Aliidongia sp.]|uniref:DUF4865 family protein n=1 Tax=Aliidongia sp. TaxID=1914230 RepID=UPI002DDD20A6
VAAKAPLLDDFPGLGLKAYLLRERGVDGAEVNHYAPFYLWASIAGMNRFLWGGGGFANIVSFIGRRPVLHWTGVACERGRAAATAPTMATRVLQPMRDGDPAPAVEQALDEMRQRAGHPDVHTTALAVDPHSWALVHFTLWRERVAAVRDPWYQVLHLSTPHLHEIAGTAF